MQTQGRLAHSRHQQRSAPAGHRRFADHGRAGRAAWTSPAGGPRWCRPVRRKPVVDQINKWFVQVVGSDETKKFLGQFGGDPLIETPEVGAGAPRSRTSRIGLSTYGSRRSYRRAEIAAGNERTLNETQARAPRVRIRLRSLMAIAGCAFRVVCGRDGARSCRRGVRAAGNGPAIPQSGYPLRHRLPARQRRRRDHAFLCREAAPGHRPHHHCREQGWCGWGDLDRVCRQVETRRLHDPVQCRQRDRGQHASVEESAGRRPQSIPDRCDHQSAGVHDGGRRQGPLSRASPT